MFDSAPRPHAAADVYAPAAMAARVADAGVVKAHLSTLQTLTLGVLAGAFIAFGAMAYTLAMTGSPLGFGPARLLGGVAFSLGLILAIVGGAELFTGNNLIVMAWADRLVSTPQLLRNWSLVYLGNFIGAVATAWMVHLSGVLSLGDMAVTAVRIAEAKVALPWLDAFARGMLANTLVCLAIWLCFAADGALAKAVMIVPPITVFVALGFEHSIANMYFIPMGWFAGAEGVTWASFAANLVPVTLGNIVGGSVLVAFVYWVVYRRR